MVALLLSKGAEADADTLYWASLGGHVDMVKFLLANDVPVNVPPDGGCPALVAAAKEDHADVGELLLSAGAQIGPRDEYADGHLLGFAARHGLLDMAERLVRRDADVNTTRGSMDLATPLLQAVRHRQTDVAELLIAHGADVNTADAYGVTPILTAVSNGDDAMTRLLLDNAADTSVTDQQGDSLLHVAAHKHNKALVAVLLAKNVDVSAENPSGETPLRMAVNGMTQT